MPPLDARSVGDLHPNDHEQEPAAGCRKANRPRTGLPYAAGQRRPRMFRPTRPSRRLGSGSRRRASRSLHAGRTLRERRWLGLRRELIDEIRIQIEGVINHGSPEVVKQLLAELIDRVEISPDRHAYPYFWVPDAKKSGPFAARASCRTPVCMGSHHVSGMITKPTDLHVRMFGHTNSTDSATESPQRRDELSFAVPGGQQCLALFLTSLTLPRVELVPRLFIAGAFIQPPIPGLAGGYTINREVINRIWLEVNGLYPYRNLQIDPTGEAAHFLGDTPEDGVAITPPVIQVRDTVTFSVHEAADRAKSILKVITKQIGAAALYQLGIKFVYNVPVGDAQSFVMGRLLDKTPEDLSALRQGGNLWTGVKYVVTNPDSSIFTLMIEPLQMEPSQLFIDLDAQFPGPVQLDLVHERARDAETFITKTVAGYLDSLGK